MTKQNAQDLTLEQIRERRARLADARAERKALEQSESELARERQALIDEEAIDQLQAAEPRRRLEIVATDLGAVALTRPKAIEWQRWVDTNDKSWSRLTHFIRGCVVYPSTERLNEIYDQQPAAVGAMSDAVARLAGMKQAQQQGE
jgi:hypothetical protein